MIFKSCFDQVVLIDCQLESSSELSVGILYIEAGQPKQVKVTDGTVSLLVTLPEESVNTQTQTTGINRSLIYERQ